MAAGGLYSGSVQLAASGQSGDHRCMKDSDTPEDPTRNGTQIAPSVIEPIRSQRLFIEMPDRMLGHLKELEDTERLAGQFGRVSRLTHCLQSATLAHRAGESEEYVTVALLHD